MKKFHVGIKGLIVDDNRVLLLKKAHKGFWEPPGGRIDSNESIEDTLRRELSEEVLNIKDISIGPVIYATRLTKDIQEDTSLLLVYYLVQARIDGKPMLSDEHDDYIWANKDKSIELMPDKTDLIDKLFVKI